MYILCSIFAVFVVLLAGELAWRKHWVRGEVGRKFVHITVGSFVACWPWYMSWHDIRLLSLAFLVVVMVSDRLKLFKAIHSAQRPTFGEICFAFSVGALTYITHDKAIYTAAILQMSLADGFAAIVGTRFGQGNRYRLLGHTKSIAGSLSFFVVSLAILCGYVFWNDTTAGILLVVLAAATATILESIATWGLDNLLVPLFIGFLLAHW